MSSENTIKITVPVEGTNDHIEVEFEPKELADLIGGQFSPRQFDLFKLYLAFAYLDAREKAYQQHTGKKFSFNEEER